MNSPHLGGAIGKNRVQRRKHVLFSGHRLYGHPYDSGLLNVLIWHGRERITGRNVFLYHPFQDSPLLRQTLHKLNFSKTHDAFVNLTYPATLVPKNLGPDLIYQKAHPRISLKRFDLSARSSTMKIYAAFKKKIVHGDNIWAIFSRDGQSADRHTFQ